MTNERPDSKQKTMRSINTDRTLLLNDNLLLSMPANFICFSIVFIGLHNQTNSNYLFIWFIAAVCTFVLHGCVCIINHVYPFPMKYYLKFLIGIAICYGALWGIAGSLLMPDNNLLSQMLVIIMSIGIASGGLHTLQPNMTASILFFVLIIIPLALWLLAQNAQTYFLIGIALFIYLAFILMVSWMGNKLLNANFKLRYENIELIKKLLISNTILEESESRFRSAFDSAAIGMALVSLEGKWLKVNQSLCLILGFSEEELLQIDFQTITYPEDLELDLNYIRQLLAGDISSYHTEKRYIQKNGSVIWILLSCSLIRGAENQPLYFIAQIQNIDSQRKAKQELKYIAYHDILTGLANRKQLDASFELALSYAKRYKNKIAILFLDLDHFKEINDTLGHDMGDLLLVEVGARLKSSIRATDILIRQGGDEFIIALTELTSAVQAVDVATKIIRAIANPIKIKRHKLFITCSIGISIYPKDGQDLSMLIKQADKALYMVKAEGKNNFRFI